MTTENKELTTINYNDAATIRTLKDTVARDLTDSEFKLFAEHCRSTGLNPFKKEVWAIKAGGRLQIMTGIGGYLAIANNHPMFDGMVVTVDNDAKPTKATCLVYRKDRKYPSEGIALMSEYGKNTPIWRDMPRVMLTKVAKSVALREAFPQEFNGTYTDVEMPPEYSTGQQPIEASPVTKTIDAQPAKQPEPIRGYYRYDIEKVAAAKREAAQALLVQAGGITDDEDRLLWESPQPVTQLSKYLLSEEA